MNTSKTLIWTDSDNRNSYKLCLNEYGIKCLNAVDISEDSVEVTFYGPTDNMTKFLEDFNEGSLEPLESKSRSLEYDEDYLAWLNNELDQLKKIN